MFTVILTGGSSRRMGRDKAMLPYEEGTLLQALIDRYKKSGPVGVSVDRVGRFPFRDAIELPDLYPGQGPMNGVISGFRATDESAILLTAVDLPYGDVALARKLDELRGTADAAAVKYGPKGIEPLFAVYGRPCYEAALACMEGGKKSLFAMLDRVNVRYVRPDELLQFDLKHIFTNVNTPEDYRQIQKRK